MSRKNSPRTSLVFNFEGNGSNNSSPTPTKTPKSSKLSPRFWTSGEKRRSIRMKEIDDEVKRLFWQISILSIFLSTLVINPIFRIRESYQESTVENDSEAEESQLEEDEIRYVIDKNSSTVRIHYNAKFSITFVRLFSIRIFKVWSACFKTGWMNI